MGIYLEKKVEVVFSTKEEALSLHSSNKKYTIGIPCEKNETRVALMPQLVLLFTNNGHRILVEKGAGRFAKINDLDYSEAGAEICDNPKNIFESDIIFKVQPPTLSEISWMKNNTILFSAVNICTQIPDYYKVLMQKKITAFCYELVKDEFGIFPFLKIMSEIAGQFAPFIASEYLSHPKYGKGNLLSSIVGIPPTNVVIIGAGTVAKFAAHSFSLLGCNIKIFDHSLYRLNRIQKMLHKSVSTVLLHSEILEKSLKEADVVVTALYSKTGISSCVISSDIVKQMKAGSVIIDVSIDQGGCAETSVPTTIENPIFVKYGVIHYCVPNITASVPYTSSYALSNVLTPIIEDFCTLGDIDKLLRFQYGLRNGVYLYHGVLTNPIIGNHIQSNSQDINLLFDTRLG